VRAVSRPTRALLLTNRWILVGRRFLGEPRRVYWLFRHQTRPDRGRLVPWRARFVAGTVVASFEQLIPLLETFGMSNVGRRRGSGTRFTQC